MPAHSLGTSTGVRYGQVPTFLARQHNAGVSFLKIEKTKELFTLQVAAKSVARLTQEPEVPGSIPVPSTHHTFVSPSPDSRFGWLVVLGLTAL